MPSSKARLSVSLETLLYNYYQQKPFCVVIFHLIFTNLAPLSVCSCCCNQNESAVVPAEICRKTSWQLLGIVANVKVLRILNIYFISMKLHATF